MQFEITDLILILLAAGWALWKLGFLRKPGPSKEQLQEALKQEATKAVADLEVQTEKVAAEFRVSKIASVHAVEKLNDATMSLEQAKAWMYSPDHYQKAVDEAKKGLSEVATALELGRIELDERNQTSTANDQVLRAHQIEHSLREGESSDRDRTNQ